MKRIGILLSLVISVYAQTEVSGIISENTTWSALSSPYIVTNNILINEGVTLTIESGSIVKFDLGKVLQVEGELIAIGMENNEIRFTSNASNPAAGDWDGIVFKDASTDAIVDSSLNYVSGSIIKSAIIEYGGPALFITNSEPYISNNLIQNNKVDGSGDIESAGIKLYFVNGNNMIVKNNIIRMNHADYYSGAAGGVRLLACGNIKIINNYFISNSAYVYNGSYAHGAGAIYSDNERGTIIISENTFFDNTMTGKDVGVIEHSIGGALYASGGDTYIESNLFINNSAISGKNKAAVLLSGVGGNFKKNNFIDNTPYHLSSIVTNLNAENNYWGTLDESVINKNIFDWFDDSNLGIIDYSPYSLSPNTDAPISPPQNVLKYVRGDIEVSWDANSESDVDGYKIHYGNYSGYSFANSIDVGNVTSYNLSGKVFQLDSVVAVTAYDNTADGSDDQIEGFESWFSLANQKNATPVITAVSDVTINEDESSTITLDATDADGDAITYSAVSDTNAITVSVSSATLTLTPAANWNGASTITAYASDGSAKDSTTFTLTVTAVNDAPTPFEWISTSLDSINISQSNLTDVYDLEWSESMDVDLEEVDYLLYAQVGVNPAEEIGDTTSTSVQLTYEDLVVNVFDSFQMLPRATVRFSLHATDGIDTVKVTGDDRVLFINRYDYLSTEEGAIPTEFALHENYPNPFNPTTTLRFDLPEVSDATVTIYNMLGQKVRTLNMNDTPAGYHSVKWDATNDYGDPVGAGVYLYQLRANEFVKTKKMVLLK